MNVQKQIEGLMRKHEPFFIKCEDSVDRVYSFVEKNGEYKVKQKIRGKKPIPISMDSEMLKDAMCVGEIITKEEYEGY